jgi:hypothetical protein
MAEKDHLTRETTSLSGTYTEFPHPAMAADSGAASEYNAATISSIVFGVFMALLTVYMIWQNNIFYKS